MKYDYNLMGRNKKEIELIQKLAVAIENYIYFINKSKNKEVWLKNYIKLKQGCKMFYAIEIDKDYVDDKEEAENFIEQLKPIKSWKEISKDNFVNNYKKGFEVLMEYWDSLPDDEKPKINERLKELGL